MKSPLSSGKQQPHSRLAFPHLCMHVALAVGYPCSMPSAAYHSILGRMRAVLGITRLLKVSASLLLPPRVSPHLRKLSVRVSREKSHFLINPGSNKKCCGCASSACTCHLVFPWLTRSPHFPGGRICQVLLKVAGKPLWQVEQPWQGPALRCALPSIPVVLAISCL